MTSTIDQPQAPQTTSDSSEALGARIFAGAIAAGEVFAIYLGNELGLYDALARRGPATATELASGAGIAQRYAREWLEQQAVAGILTTDGDVDAEERRYALAPGHAEVLNDANSPYYAVGVTMMLAGVARALPQLPGAFKDGSGVAYGEFGTEIRRGIAAFNRPAFLHELGSVWLPSITDVHEHLSTAPRARILDLGCGIGTSSIAMARAYPNVEVLGIDLDPVSVQEADEAARAAGLGNRVSFRVGDAAEEPAAGGFDLVTIFEALHDMGDPAGALRTARGLLAKGGSVLVADERVADVFTAPGDELERLNYVFSVLHCLPATMAENPVEANGTVLRAATVRRWADAAGFSRVEELPIEFPFWRFYRLVG